MIHVCEDITNPDREYNRLLKLLGKVPENYWLLDELRGKSVLELGCGAGNLALRAGEYGYDYHAVDIVEELISYIEGFHFESVKTYCEDIGDLCLERKFDLVLSKSCMLNNNDPLFTKNLLDCAKRHVASSGVILVEAFDPEKCRLGTYAFPEQNISFVKVRDSENVRCTCDYHFESGFTMTDEVRLYRVNELRHILQDNGLSIVDVKPADPLTLMLYAVVT